MSATESAGFDAHVLAWLHSEWARTGPSHDQLERMGWREDPSKRPAWALRWTDDEPVEVTKVNGDGSDWEGDTEGGFYSRFGVEVTYRTKAGETKHRAFVGEDMSSLWDHVVRGWPL